jgi:hypothetical protein
MVTVRKWPVAPFRPLVATGSFPSAETHLLAGHGPPSPAGVTSSARLHLRLLCHFQCVIDLDPEIAHRAL